MIYPGRIPPPDIGFVNALLDDHEEIAVARTEDPAVGRMEFWVSPDMTDEFLAFIDYVKTEYQIPITIGEPIPQSTELEEFFKKRQQT